MADASVAAVVVRNTASHDARVLRCARALQTLGYETLVLAVTSDEESETRAVAQGVPIVRLSPRAPLAEAVRGLRGRAHRRTGIATTEAEPTVNSKDFAGDSRYNTS